MLSLINFFYVGNGTVPSTEIQALQDFYNATNGPNWDCLFDYGLNYWSFSSNANPCLDNWVGITCIEDTQEYNHIKTLSLPYCNIYGTIPNTINQLTNLTVLDLSDNNIYGTIPSYIGELSYLNTLTLSTNQLTGSIPNTISLLYNLQTLYLYNNNLNNNIENILNPIIQTQLKFIDISYNSLTGIIPDIIFYNSTIEKLNLGYNCFHGKLTTSICESKELIELDLHCLSCGNQCITHYIKNSNFIINNPIHGTIPECIFQLSQLNSLVLSQNYFTGQISNELNITSLQLYTIDLSYNHLSGNIPRIFFETKQHDRQIILNYNHFNNGLTNIENIYQDSEIKVSYNRLSGNAIGSNWDNSIEVDILTGNIFACRDNRNDLPKNDDAYIRYQCGSDNINQPLYTWCGIILLCCIIVCIIILYRTKIEKYIGITYILNCLQCWKDIVYNRNIYIEIPIISKIFHITQILLNTTMICCSIILLLYTPIYILLSIYYGTYKHQYGWIISSLLLSGRLPFAICFVCYILLSTITIIYLIRKYRFSTTTNAKSDSNNDTTTNNTTTTTTSTTIPLTYNIYRTTFACFLYIFVNFIVVGCVNIAYVATSAYASPVYQIGISGFKVFWSVVTAPYFSRLLAYELSTSRTEWFTLELFVSLMCNIGIPLLSVIFISPQCFYNLFGGQIDILINSDSATPNHNQAFYYYYQCSYVYMDYYTAAFIDMCLMASFGTPFIEIVGKMILINTQPNSYLSYIIKIFIPRILHPIETLKPNFIIERSLLKPYFDTTQYLISQLTYFTMILTIGIIFPPLALTLTITMYITSYYCMNKVGYYISTSYNNKQIQYIDIIKKECEIIVGQATIHRAFLLIYLFCCIFYTLFLFDILGDSVGFMQSYWVLIVVPLLSVGFYAIDLIISYFYTIPIVNECINDIGVSSNGIGSMSADMCTSVEGGDLGNVDEESRYSSTAEMTNTVTTTTAVDGGEGGDGVVVFNKLQT